MAVETAETSQFLYKLKSVFIFAKLGIHLLLLCFFDIMNIITILALRAITCIIHSQQNMSFLIG